MNEFKKRKNMFLHVQEHFSTYEQLTSEMLIWPSPPHLEHFKGAAAGLIERIEKLAEHSIYPEEREFLKEKASELREQVEVMERAEKHIAVVWAFLVVIGMSQALERYEAKFNAAAVVH